jgi:hypothetical protein
MSQTLTPRRLVWWAAAAALLTAAPAAPQAPGPPPRLEPVAETRLLMEALNLSNFRGLEKQLRQKPADADAWTFARGQALLIAETGNLLLLRPPRNPGQAAWMDRAAELRTTATRLARAAANRDYERSRAGLGEVAHSCNRCHQTFRVAVRVVPFAEPGERTGPPAPSATGPSKVPLDKGDVRD